jgi:hypothetical protein
LVDPCQKRYDSIPSIVMFDTNSVLQHLGYFNSPKQELVSQEERVVVPQVESQKVVPIQAPDAPIVNDVLELSKGVSAKYNVHLEDMKKEIDVLMLSEITMECASSAHLHFSSVVPTLEEGISSSSISCLVSCIGFFVFSLAAIHHVESRTIRGQVGENDINQGMRRANDKLKKSRGRRPRPFKRSRAFKFKMVLKNLHFYQQPLTSRHWKMKC